MAGYWKFNTSLLEIRDFRDRLESLIKRVFVGAVTRNRWWVSLKHRIRNFATNYGRQINLDRPKSIEDRISRAVADGDLLTVELARRDLECKTSEFYKGIVVRSRLKKSTQRSCEIERDRTRGRSAKVSRSVYRFRQVLRWARAAIESQDT